MALQPTYSPREVARHLGIGLDKVLRLIRAGELQAINLAMSATAKPRYRVTQEALDAFKASRTVAKPAPIIQPRRRAMEGVIEFF